MTGETRKKHHFNLVDIFLILVLLLCVVGLVLRAQLEDTFLTETKELTVVCTTDAVPTAFQDFIAEDTTLYLADGTKFGVCTAVSVQNAVTTLEDTAGGVHEVSDPTAVYLTFTVRVFAEQNTDGYAIESTKIDVNRVLELHTERAVYSVTLLSVNESDS